MKKNINLTQRPRRNRQNEAIRSLVSETDFHVGELVMPLFVIEGTQQRIAVTSMPGIDRLSVDLLVKEVEELYDLGINAVALFPSLPDNLKDKNATESKNIKGLLQTAVRAIKESTADICVITDVAMDPYSSDGHDGLVEGEEIVNDATLPILAEMAVAQAKAGADIVAPSDMMDGRVGYIRQALDDAGFTHVGILAYSAKYCSAFYGPFRDALDSKPKAGDKKTYQMDPANIREALREVQLDIEEGADMVMVKPALPYLDVIRVVREMTDVPVVAYNVSGEYSMICAAAQNGWLDREECMMESLTSIKRAGADIIFTYFAKDVAKLLHD
ncbi:MAG: porphobilinogen synthase [Candidatus Omnitrophota bacterium]|jgi:porphobilinogen synthase